MSITSHNSHACFAILVEGSASSDHNFNVSFQHVVDKIRFHHERKAEPYCCLNIMGTLVHHFT